MGTVEIAPLSGDNNMSTVSVEGYEPKPEENMNPYVNWVGSGYFSAMGIPLVAGREFTRRDDAGAPKVAVINETHGSRVFRAAKSAGNAHRHRAERRIWTSRSWAWCATENTPTFGRRCSGRCTLRGRRIRPSRA